MEVIKSRIFEIEGEMLEEKIMELINQYSKKHPCAKECGSEYIYQNDKAQVDALELIADIFDLMVEISTF